MFFEDRKDAGERLVAMVEQYKGAADALVLGLPRGGTVVALQIAKALDLPMDVWGEPAKLAHRSIQNWLSAQSTPMETCCWMIMPSGSTRLATDTYARWRMNR